MPMPARFNVEDINHDNPNYTHGSSQDTNNVTANMYRVGDYVYFETSSTSPYQIRRIEELNKTSTGNVEAKVMCFFRRRDLPPNLIMLADKHQWMDEGISLTNNGNSAININNGSNNSGSSASNYGNGFGELTPKQRHQMKHRELFLSRQVETMPATHIRGKCCVTLLNETESLLSYLNKDDTFFYCLVFDPAQRTLLADKGEIRVGSRYQADGIAPTALTQAEREADTRKLQDLETMVWTPRHSLTDRQIDQFLVVSRSVGTFARALDCSSSIKQPSLHMSAAAASRDVTLLYAMDTLHKHNYDVALAMSSLVPSSGPVLCKDEMEEWSASEANLFEEALEKYGKDFGDIRHDFLPWKTLKNVIEYYYMWKTTDRYVQQKRVKAVEAESKLKQVYIPNYSQGSPGPAAAIVGQSTIIPIPANSMGVTSNGKPLSGIINGATGSNGELLIGAAAATGKPCEGCQTVQSAQWYAWGSANSQTRLCHVCWSYWKKYGGLKVPSRADDTNDPKRVAATAVAAASGAGSDDEGRPAGAGGPHRPHRCTIVNCGKEFKLKAHLSRHYASAHGLDLRTAPSGQVGGFPHSVNPLGFNLGTASGGSPRPMMKTRSAFYLRTSALARAARRLCATQFRSRHVARAPHQSVNAMPLRQLCASPQLANKSPAELRVLARAIRPRQRPRVADIASRIGCHTQPNQPGDWDWLHIPPQSLRKQPDHVAFPRPPKAPDGSLLYERIPNRPEVERLDLTPPLHPSIQVQQGIKRNRPTIEELNGVDGVVVTPLPVSGGPPAKRVATQHTINARDHPAISLVAGVTLANASPSTTTNLLMPGNGVPLSGRPPPLASSVPMSRSNVRKQLMSWMDAPDDVYFRSNEQIRRLRRSLTAMEVRRGARKPWRRMIIPQKPNQTDVVVLD